MPRAPVLSHEHPDHSIPATGPPSPVPPLTMSAGDDAGEPAPVGALNRALHAAEDVLYGLIALILVALAVVVLVDAGSTLARESSHDVSSAVQATLESLLTVFILVELLGAVRTTIKERRLVAEPFLLVGVIASIKEIVVVGAHDDMTIEDAMLKIGVLGAVILALSVAGFLLRRKEREPAE